MHEGQGWEGQGIWLGLSEMYVAGDSSFCIGCLKLSGEGLRTSRHPITPFTPHKLKAPEFIKKKATQAVLPVNT